MVYGKKAVASDDERSNSLLNKTEKARDNFFVIFCDLGYETAVRILLCNRNRKEETFVSKRPGNDFFSRVFKRARKVEKNGTRWFRAIACERI